MVHLLFRQTCAAMALTAVMALGLLPVAASESPKLTMTAIMDVLKSSGFQPEAIKTAPPAFLIGQIVVNVANIKVLVGMIRCRAPNTEAICALSFTSTFNDTAGLSKDTIIAMNNASLLRVLMPLGADGQPIGFWTVYTYPCEGFQDAQFVPMVLKIFRDGVTLVSSVYLKLRPPAAGASTSAGTAAIPSNSTSNDSSSITPDVAPGGASVDLPTSP
jgi:hypothetical protein